MLCCTVVRVFKIIPNYVWLFLPKAHIDLNYWNFSACFHKGGNKYNNIQKSGKPSLHCKIFSPFLTQLLSCMTNSRAGLNFSFTGHHLPFSVQGEWGTIICSWTAVGCTDEFLTYRIRISWRRFFHCTNAKWQTKQLKMPWHHDDYIQCELSGLCSFFKQLDLAAGIISSVPNVQALTENKW